MVRGIGKFREYFGEFSGQYAFIGGTACDIILGRRGVDFRATKDLDLVLLIEALDEQFVQRMIAFAEAGGYQHVNKGTGENQFYRFEKPLNADFPYMIELFSKRPDYMKSLDARLAPIHISEDAVSLSAILLDDEYYQLLKAGRVVIDEISVLDLEYIMLFKMKAWLDLSERKVEGEQIDSKNIKKHKNDVLRLAANIEPGKTVFVSEKIKADVGKFIRLMTEEKTNAENLGIRGVTYNEIMEMIKNCFGINNDL